MVGVGENLRRGNRRIIKAVLTAAVVAALGGVLHASAVHDSPIAPSAQTTFQVSEEHACWSGRQLSQDTVTELALLQAALVDVRLHDISGAVTLADIVATTNPLVATTTTASGSQPATDRAMIYDNPDFLPGVYMPALIRFASTLPATTRFASTEEAATRYASTRSLSTSTSPTTRVMSVAGPLTHALYYGEVREDGGAFASATQPKIQPELLKAISFMRSVAASNTSAPATEIIRRMANTLGPSSPTTQNSANSYVSGDIIDALAHKVAAQLAGLGDMDTNASASKTVNASSSSPTAQDGQARQTARTAQTSALRRVGPLDPQDVAPKGPDRNFLSRYLIDASFLDTDTTPTYSVSVYDPKSWLTSVFGLASSSQFVRDWVDNDCRSAEPVASPAISGQSVAGGTFIPPQQVSQTR